MYLAFFLCVYGIILFISIATTPPGAGILPPQCVDGYVVGLCGAGSNVSVPAAVVAAVTVVSCTVLCVTTVGILVYSCTEDCPIKIYILCLFL